MIKNKTVFVVGAGASVPYGFPSGPGLINEYRKHDARLITKITCGAVNSMEALALHEALQASSAGSIDALLEHRPDLEDSGKKLIAAHLLRNETRFLIQSVWDGDWIKHLIGIMAEEARSPEEFSNGNSVSFVTYNYDRLIEHKISSHIWAHWKTDQVTIKKVLDCIPVIHLHGSLGDLHKGSAYIPFGRFDKVTEGEKPLMVNGSAKSVRIVHQVDGSDVRFANAQRLLREANTVFFLGFGFGRTNIQRLDFRNLPTANVVASHFDLTRAEYEKNFVQLLNAARGRTDDYPFNSGWDCLKTLRESATRLV